MKPQPVLSLFCFILGALLAAGSAHAGSESGLSQPAIKANARPTAYPARIITLAPHITELIFAAGAGERIIATVSSSDYPPAARRIARIGNGIQVNVERVVALKPDLVAAWGPAGAALTLQPILSRLHIPLIYIKPSRLQDIPEDIIKLGHRLGTEPAARHQAALLQERVDALTRDYAGRTPVSVFIEVGSAPLYTIGKDPLLNNALQSCSGKNIYGSAALAAPQISAENVLLARPAVVIVPTNDPAHLRERLRFWSRLQLPAALQGHVYAIDPDELFRPGPRLVDAAEKLCRDLDLARAAAPDGIPSNGTSPDERPLHAPTQPIHSDR